MTKRRRFGEGLAGSHFSEAGVNKLIFLCVAMGAGEDRGTLEKVFEPLGLQPGDFSLNADLKLLNEALGLMSHSSRYPCPFCLWRKDGHGYPKMRTFEGISKWAEKLKREGGEAKYYYNCVAQPLSIFPKFGRVLDFIAPPELHLLTGVVNKVYNELVAVHPEASEWAKVQQFSTSCV